jgi:hypothetical protein
VSGERFMKEITVKMYTKDNLRWIECEELNIFSFAQTFKKAFKEFGEELDILISHYGMCPDNLLAKEAIDLKEYMLELIQEEEDAGV